MLRRRVPPAHNVLAMNLIVFIVVVLFGIIISQTFPQEIRWLGYLFAFASAVAAAFGVSYAIAVGRRKASIRGRRLP